MSGFEYAFAAILIMNGYTDEAERVVGEVRKRYDGEKRNPWNDIECGANYVRSMAAFSLIPAMSGFVADLPEKRLTFNVRTNKRPFGSVWFTATGWGVFELDGSRVTVLLKRGYVKLKELGLEFLKSVSRVTIDGKDAEFTYSEGIVHFGENKISKGITVCF